MEVYEEKGEGDGGQSHNQRQHLRTREKRNSQRKTRGTTEN